MATVTTRIAPSPTGRPTIATLYQGLFNYAVAKKEDGRFLIRIEDTDRTRLVEGAMEAIADMLDWSGLVPDESPWLGGPVAPYIQSERKERHQEIAHQLVRDGHAYYDFTTAEETEIAIAKLTAEKEHEPTTYERRRYVYGKWREMNYEDALALTKIKPYVIRIKIPDEGHIEVEDVKRGWRAFNAREVDEKVLLKGDGFPTYHLAAMVDDYDMGVTHVIRAEEWFSSLPVHVSVYRALGWKEPVFCHTPLIRDAQGKKLSKRKGDTYISQFREQGIVVEALINYLTTLGWTHPYGDEFYSLQEFIRLFDIYDIVLGSPKYSIDRLLFYNAKYISELLDEDILLEKLKDFIDSSYYNDLNKLKQAIGQVRLRAKTLVDFKEMLSFFFQAPIYEESANIIIAQHKPLLKKMVKVIASEADIEAFVRKTAKDNNVKLASIAQPLRAAITGRLASPGLFEVIDIIGREESARRIKAVI